MKALVFLLLAGAVPIAQALEPSDMADLKNRLIEIKTYGDESKPDGIDVRSIKSDWSENAARATIKYSKPQLYIATLKRVYVRNDSDGDLILDAGGGKEISAILFPYQLGPWEKKPDGKFAATGGVTTLEFAAMYNAGQKFVLHCKEAKPDYLFDCIALPGEAVK